MIRNLSNESGTGRQNRFRFLTAFVAVLFFCSATVTAFAAANIRRVAVVDGKKTINVSTQSSDPREIVERAGLKLGANDKLDLSKFNPEKGGTIIVGRAKAPGARRDGLAACFRSAGARFNNELFGGARNGAGKDFPSSANGLPKIDIKRIEYKTKSEKRAIDFKVEIVRDPDMYTDEEKITVPGRKGEKIVFYVEKRVDGALKGTLLLKEVVITDPVAQVKKVGSKKRTVLSAFKDTGVAISDLKVPGDLKLDKNGIPTNYAYCVKGRATAYADDPATASGMKPMPGRIAVDPKEYPYGTELYIVSADGRYVYGYCVAADTGGFVSMGNADVDLYMDNENMCCDWGNRNVKIYVLR